MVADGGEVLRIIGRQETLDHAELNLIILDLNLPRHDGIEILRRFRDAELLHRIPVVVLTSSDSPRDRALATELGAVRFSAKAYKSGTVFKSGSCV